MKFIVHLILTFLIAGGGTIVLIVLSLVFHIGYWLSLVERCIWDAEVVGSNPTYPICGKSNIIIAGGIGWKSC